MLTWALKYCRLGYSIIPLKPRSKEPLIKWVEYQNQKATEDEVRAWWFKTPDANVGLITGSVSGLVVIDLDGIPGLDFAQSKSIVSSAVVKTGNGKQLYYRDVEGTCKNTVKKISAGVDTRGEGGYVVAPPSLHPNGTRYAWLTPVLGVNQLPPFPANIFVPDATIPATSTTTTVVNEPGWIAQALEDMTDGNIDNTLFKICSRLRNDNYSERDAFILLSPHARRVRAEMGHLEEKIRNVWSRYEPKNENKMRLHSSDEQSLFLSSNKLVIHSPTNADSIDQYNLHMESANRVTDFPTGYAKFDALTGGLRRSEVLTVAARTGVGKTNWLIGPARTLCESGKKVLLCSTEMSFDQIWSRYIKTLKDPDQFRSHQFYVCDEFAPTTSRVEEALNQIKPDVLMFDHINNISEEQKELAEFMKGLKFLARKFDIPVIMTAQLNRLADWVEKGERVMPRLSMIKGAGAIEEVSGQVLLLSETRVNLEGTEIVGVVDKNRWGNKGLVQFILKQTPWRVEEI